MSQEFANAKAIMGDKTKTRKGRMCHLLPVSKKGSHACSCDSTTTELFVLITKLLVIHSYIDFNMVPIKLFIVFILSAAAITPLQVVALPHGDHMGLSRRSTSTESNRNTDTSTTQGKPK